MTGDTPTAFLVGATSMVAQHLAEQYAMDGWSLVLAARDATECRLLAEDIRIRFGADVRVVPFLAEDPHTHAAAVAEVVREEACPAVTLVLLGQISTSPADAYDPAAARRMVDANYTSTVSLVTHLLPALERTPGAAIGFVTSVAGDRGRAGNYLYGSAKAAVNVFAQGLRARLHPLGVHVLTVKLGFVDTRLSYGRAPRWMVMSPARAARSIRRAVSRRVDIAYIPWFWRWIMLLIRVIPEGAFKRLPAR